MYRKKSQKGFTLIEILVVVSIVGILATITIPMYQDYVDRAKNSAALSDLKNLKAAMSAYFSENQVYPSN